MAAHLKATIDQLVESYGRTRSVHATGQEFGMCGQSVHERLAKHGIIKSRRRFTEAEKNRLRSEYWAAADSGSLAKLAAEMGRAKSWICMRARELGLTKQSRKKQYLAPVMSARMKQWHVDNAHPRGMSGKRHSKKTKDHLRETSSSHWHSLSKEDQIEIFSRSKTSWKADWRTVGARRCFFRSSWEANYARYLEWLRCRGKIKQWDHEPITFWFAKIKRGTRSYLPDFRVMENNGEVVFHEVKGWMDGKSKTKIKRMKIYHPHIRLVVVDGASYRSIEKMMSRMIEGWE